MITIVVGPAGCGKTRNAKLIAEKLGCTAIIDGGGLGKAKEIFEAHENILYLTNQIQNVTGDERRIKAVIPYYSLGLKS